MALVSACAYFSTATIFTPLAGASFSIAFRKPSPYAVVMLIVATVVALFFSMWSSTALI